MDSEDSEEELEEGGETYHARCRKELNQRLRPGIYNRELEFELPLFLLRELWIRHGYSRKDVEQTLKSYISVTKNIFPLI